MDARVGDADVVRDQDAPAVGVEVHRSPPGAVRRLEDDACGCREFRVHDPDVVRRAVTARALERHHRAIAREHHAAVAGFAVGDHRRLRRGRIQQEQLAELAAAGVHREHELRAARAPLHLADGLVEEGHLAAGAARHVDLVDLVNVAEARRDVHAVAVLAPVEEAGRARVLILVQVVNDILRDLGDIFEDEHAVIRFAAFHVRPGGDKSETQGDQRYEESSCAHYGLPLVSRTSLTPGRAKYHPHDCHRLLF